MLSVHHLHRLLASSTLLLSLLSLHFAIVFAQDSSSLPQRANLSIVVSDPSGAVIPNAEVRFEGRKNLTTKTAQNGSVQVALPYGSYVVWITSRSFKTAKINGFPIHVPKPPDLDVVLQLGHYCDDCCDECPLAIQTITSDLPNVIEPNVTVPLWSWFGNCDDKRYIGLEVVLTGKVIYRSFFPICPVADRAKAAECQQKVVAFSARGGHVFQGEYHTTRNETIEGNIWQAGTDPGAILLGLSFSTKKQVVLNTIHVARVDSESTSETDRGLIVRTFPTSKPK